MKHELPPYLLLQYEWQTKKDTPSPIRKYLMIFFLSEEIGSFFQVVLSHSLPVTE